MSLGFVCCKTYHNGVVRSGPADKHREHAVRPLYCIVWSSSCSLVDLPQASHSPTLAYNVRLYVWRSDRPDPRVAHPPSVALEGSRRDMRRDIEGAHKVVQAICTGSFSVAEVGRQDVCGVPEGVYRSRRAVGNRDMHSCRQGLPGLQALCATYWLFVRHADMQSRKAADIGNPREESRRSMGTPVTPSMPLTHEILCSVACVPNGGQDM
jgi:hypothetical protein